MTDALPSSIKLSPIQREVLDQIVHVLTSTQDPVWPERAILLWGDGVSDSTTARELDVSEETVRILRHRWFSWMARIAAAEKKVHKAFAEIPPLLPSCGSILVCGVVKTWGSAGVIESYRGFSDLRVMSLQKRMHHVHLVDLRFDANFGAKPLWLWGFFTPAPTITAAR